jgi:hypothetical protein
LKIYRSRLKSLLPRPKTKKHRIRGVRVLGFHYKLNIVLNNFILHRVKNHINFYNFPHQLYDIKT